MAKIQPPSGFRDLLPEQCRRRAELIERIRDVYESFGFEPMDTPIAESLAVLLGKGGGENEKLMFRLLKRGAELERVLEQRRSAGGTGPGPELADLGLRFDLTVPLARYYATHRAELPAVFKRYQIAPVFRAERPQHGRYREFVQCDVDILGSRSALAEVEVIIATTTVLASLGFQDLRVKLNARPLLTLLIKSLGVSDEHLGAALIAVDKRDKVPPAALATELASKGIPSETAHALLNFMEHTDPLASEDRMATVVARTGDAGLPLIATLREILGLTTVLPGGRLEFDPFLARGLDYYTGPIFEIGTPGVPFSLAGGGRYDELVGALSGISVPAVGFSIGFERVLTILDERNMLGAHVRKPVVFIAVPDPSAYEQALALASEVRATGAHVDLYVGTAKLTSQFELAEKKGLRWVVVAESEELSRGQVPLRNLSERRNVAVPRAEIATVVHSDRFLGH